MEKITKREMFVTLSEMADAMVFPADAEINAEAVKAFCENEIELLDKKAEKARERAATKAKEGDALTSLTQAALTGDFRTIPEIASVVMESDPDATVAKVQYRLGQLVKNHLAEKHEMTIPATETTKTRRVMGYRLLTEGDNDEG